MFEKLFKLAKENWIFLVIFAVGMFLRIYKPYEWFMYSHDQDLAAWFVKDVVRDGHIRLIGQETSSKGVFIGPLFYYLLIPFYAFTAWDPKGSVWLPILLSALSIWSFYFIFSKIFNKKVGIIATLIYAFSYNVIFVDREVVPTMPVMLWAVWFFYALARLEKGKQKAYIILGFLGGLIWHLSLALALLSPLVVVAQLLSKTKINFKYLGLGMLIFSLLMSPFIAFEARHGFQQVKAISSSFTTQKDYIEGTSTGFAKMDRLFQLINKNSTALFWDSVFDIPAAYTLYLLVALFLILVFKKIIPKNLALIFILWQVLYILFFTFNSINISEYYLNGMNIVWIAIMSIGVGRIFALKRKEVKVFGWIFVLTLVSLNLYAFFNFR